MKVAPVSNICYLVFHAHLCPVGPRVLDSCSLNIRAGHIQEAYEPPWARAWFILISWGHKVVWGFITILYLCHALLLYLNCARSTLYCLGKRSVFAVSTSPVTFSGSQSFTAIDANLESVSESANFVAGVLNGVGPWNISESCDCFVVKASLGFDLVFPRLVECVLLFVHPCRVKLSESRVRGYGRLGAQYLDHRQL